MPLFLSDEDFAQISDDADAVRKKAESFIRDLHNQLETTRAHADAASITSEQAFSLVEQKYLFLSFDFTNLQTEKEQVKSELDDRIEILAQCQAEKQKLHLVSVERDGHIERLSTEMSELHKSKRQLMSLLEDKDSEIGEKDATIKSYLDKIVGLVDDGVVKDSKLRDIETEVLRARASITCLSQEKELIQKHNTWLNDELTLKVNSILDIRKSQTQHDAEMSTKLDDAERQLNDCLNSLKWNKERVKELEEKISALQEELCSSKEVAAVHEVQFSAEVGTLNKLVELYKESSEEWSIKSADLEGVIKAMEMHFKQAENKYKQTIEKESSMRKEFEKEALDLKEKLGKCQAELENIAKETEANVFPLRSISSESWARQLEASGNGGNDLALVPTITADVSGTAIAASLLRDGWSLAKMYSKYQEAIDAFRHEEHGRKQAQAVLEQVLSEIEGKAAVILDDRAEHEKMTVAYSSMSRKLQDAISEHTKLENIIELLKADVRRSERDYSVARKEIYDLQMQVSVLLKECRDIQLRCGPDGPDDSNNGEVVPSSEISDYSDVDKVISGRLLTFKDIRQLVEQNVQLRSLVRSLSAQIENKELEFAQKIELEIQKHNAEAGSKVAAVLERAAEQSRMVESLHNSVSMYKRLYEEGNTIQASGQQPDAVTGEPAKSSLMLLLESSKESKKKAEEQASVKIRCMEEELSKCRNEITSLRSERDKMELAVKFSQERFERLIKELDHQRSETNGILRRNFELSSLIVDYQRRLRENSDTLRTAEEHSKKFTMEVSFLKQEKELLIGSARRDSDEVHSLRERVYRLQATLDTISATEEAREEVRSIERKRQDEHIKHIETEWAEAKKEIHDQRDITRTLTIDRENTMKIAMKQVDDANKELAKSLQVVASAEARAAAAEVRCTELEKKVKMDVSVVGDPLDSGTSQSMPNEVNKNEFEELKLTAQANKDHMEQYKNIALVNEAALKQMELSYLSFKSEAESIKRSLDDEVSLLRNRTCELEELLAQNYIEMSSAVSKKEEELSSASTEIAVLNEENSSKSSRISELEIQISVLNGDLDKEKLRFRAAQGNYERQVVLQSETIQELAKTSESFALLQEESLKFRKLADSYETECNDLRVNWENEKLLMEKTKHETETNIAEINEQNKILHCRVETLHIKLAERDCSAAGLSFKTVISEDGDSGLQNVINYLRRSKEIAETEISLLKQERNRLQSQLESSLKSAEEAHTALVSQRENSRAMLFTEEEIKSLQLQVNEINLLRESNTQLREENKHNFQECQKLLEVSHKYRVDVDNLEILLKKKEAEVDSLQMEMEVLRTEKENMKTQIYELNERCKSVDVEDYRRLKVESQNIQESLRVKDVEIEETKKLIQNKKDNIAQLELDLVNCRQELGEKQESLNAISKNEANQNSDIERKRKIISHLKNRIETLSDEKEVLGKENSALVKQVEYSKQGGQEKEGEKDTRIHILERTLEKHREELRREKYERQTEREKRISAENSFSEAYRNVSQEKSRFGEELEKHKQAVKLLSDEIAAKSPVHGGTSLVPFLPNNMLDGLPAPYALAVENLEKVVLASADNISADLTTASLSDPSAMEVTTFIPQVEEMEEEKEPGKSRTGSSSPIKPVSEPVKPAVEKKSGLGKPGPETRRTGRKLIRPRLVRSGEPQVDTEATDAGEGSVPETSSGLRATSLSLHRKRVAPASSSDASKEPKQVRGEPVADLAPPVQKKSRGPHSDEAADPDGQFPVEDLSLPETVAVVSASNETPPSVQLVSGTNETPPSVSGPSEMQAPFQLVREASRTEPPVQLVPAANEIAPSVRPVSCTNGTPPSVMLVSCTNETPPSVQLVSGTGEAKPPVHSVPETNEVPPAVPLDSETNEKPRIVQFVSGANEIPPSVQSISVANETQPPLQSVSETNETPPSVQPVSEPPPSAAELPSSAEPAAKSEAEEGEYLVQDDAERGTDMAEGAPIEKIDTEMVVEDLVNHPSPQDVCTEVEFDQEEGEFVAVSGMETEEDEQPTPGVSLVDEEEEEEEEEGEEDREVVAEGGNQDTVSSSSGQVSPGCTPEREEGKPSSPTSSTINISERARQRALIRQAGGTSHSSRLNYRGRGGGAGR